ncbi:MAG: DNA-3-methyladenine glycosylase 2 family protein [Actinobacteria bacterium]|nr:MAG: DNA-3-methyladenine glycosylase 2 family protein [Actinomycetota bacterium]
MTVRRIELQHPVDLRRTIFPLIRGTGDPTARVEGGTVWRAVRTPDGPATMKLRQSAISTIEAEAWGPGAECAVAVDAPGAVGSFDDTTSFVARDPMVALAWVAAVLEQKVMGTEARTAWRRVVQMTADEAPGDHGLRLPPDAERVASLPPSELTRLGVTGTRAATLREVARHPKKIAALAGAPFNEARSWLRRLPGVGPWTEAEVARLALGDPDAVSVGDFHLPNIVAWALAGETRGTDDRMLELLEPYRGQRGRVQLLLEASGITAPRFGPKLERRTFF